MTIPAESSFVQLAHTRPPLGWHQPQRQTPWQTKPLGHLSPSGVSDNTGPSVQATSLRQAAQLVGLPAELGDGSGFSNFVEGAEGTDNRFTIDPVLKDVQIGSPAIGPNVQPLWQDTPGTRQDIPEIVNPSEPPLETPLETPSGQTDNTRLDNTRLDNTVTNDIDSVPDTTPGDAIDLSNISKTVDRLSTDRNAPPVSQVQRQPLGQHQPLGFRQPPITDPVTPVQRIAAITPVTVEITNQPSAPPPDGVNSIETPERVSEKETLEEVAAKEETSEVPMAPNTVAIPTTDATETTAIVSTETADPVAPIQQLPKDAAPKGIQPKQLDTETLPGTTNLDESIQRFPTVAPPELPPSPSPPIERENLLPGARAPKRPSMVEAPLGEAPNTVEETPLETIDDSLKSTIQPALAPPSETGVETAPKSSFEPPPLAPVDPSLEPPKTAEPFEIASTDGAETIQAKSIPLDTVPPDTVPPDTIQPTLEQREAPQPPWKMEPTEELPFSADQDSLLTDTAQLTPDLSQQQTFSVDEPGTRSTDSLAKDTPTPISASPPETLPRLESPEILNSPENQLIQPSPQPEQLTPESSVTEPSSPHLPTTQPQPSLEEEPIQPPMEALAAPQQEIPDSLGNETHTPISDNPPVPTIDPNLQAKLQPQIRTDQPNSPDKGQPLSAEVIPVSPDFSPESAKQQSNQKPNVPPLIQSKSLSDPVTQPLGMHELILDALTTDRISPASETMEPQVVDLPTIQAKYPQAQETRLPSSNLPSSKLKALTSKYGVEEPTDNFFSSDDGLSSLLESDSPAAETNAMDASALGTMAQTVSLSVPDAVAKMAEGGNKAADMSSGDIEDQALWQLAHILYSELRTDLALRSHAFPHPSSSFQRASPNLIPPQSRNGQQLCIPIVLWPPTLHQLSTNIKQQITTRLYQDSHRSAQAYPLRIHIH